MDKVEQSLAERLKARDSQAADELVDLYYKAIYSYLRRLGFDCAASEDLTQESFMRAWQHVHQLRNDNALKAWLYLIAGNTARQHWRKMVRRDAISFNDMDCVEQNSLDCPDGEVEVSEMISKLENGIKRLPMKLKEAVVLHYLEQMSIAEAAEAAGVRQGTFKSRLSRALSTLRRQMDGQE